MRLIRKITAAIAAMAVTASIIADVPVSAEKSYPLDTVKASYSSVLGDDRDIGAFGPEWAGLSEIMTVTETGKSVSTFGDTKLLWFGNTVTDKFRSTGKLSPTKVTYDERLENCKIYSQYQHPFLCSDYAAEKTYVACFDEDSEKIKIRRVLEGNIYSYFYIPFSDGNLVESFTGISGATLISTSAKGSEKTKNIDNYSMYIYGDHTYIFMFGKNGTDNILYKLGSDLTMNKVGTVLSGDSKIRYPQVFHSSDDDRLYISYDTDSTHTKFGIAEYDPESGKTSVFYTGSYPSGTPDNTHVTCTEILENWISVGVYGIFDEEMQISKTSLLKLVNRKTGEVLDFPDCSSVWYTYDESKDSLFLKDNNGKTGIYSIKKKSYITDKYDDIDSLCYKGIIRCRDFNDNGDTIKEEYFDASLRKLKYDHITEYDTKTVRNDNKEDHYTYTGAGYAVGYQELDYTLVCKDGKAWFADKELTQVSAKFKADNVWKVCGGLFGYSVNGKKYFVSYKENGNAAPAKVSGLKVTGKSKNSLTLKWDKTAGADGYSIDIYKNGKWTNIGTTKKTTVKIPKLSSGTKYKIRVRAYKGSSSKKYGKAAAVSAKTKT